RMLAHAEVVVGAPDRDLVADRLGLRLLLAPVIGRAGEAADVPLQIGEDPVVAFRLQPVDRVDKAAFVIHWLPVPWLRAGVILPDDSRPALRFRKKDPDRLVESMRHEVARRTGPSFDRLDVNVRRSQRSVNDSGGLRAA